MPNNFTVTINGTSALAIHRITGRTNASLHLNTGVLFPRGSTVGVSCSDGPFPALRFTLVGYALVP